MTKQEFLDGKEFMYDNTLDTCFVYDDGCIIELYYIKGRIVRSRWQANVESIGTKCFKYYTYILGKRVQGKINFLEL